MPQTDEKTLNKSKHITREYTQKQGQHLNTAIPKRHYNRNVWLVIQQGRGADAIP